MKFALVLIFSSAHQQGVDFKFTDGSVRMIPPAINLESLYAYFDRNDALISTGTTRLFRPERRAYFDRNDALISTGTTPRLLPGFSNKKQLSSQPT